MYLAMMNQGNLLDIEAELKRQIQEIGPEYPYSKWQRVASAVISAQDNETFHTSRCSIFQPALSEKPTALPQLITQSKDALIAIPGAPQVDVDDISWDAVSYKIAPTAAEIFSQRYPAMLDTLSIHQLAIIDKIEQITYQAIVEKCAEYRSRTESSQDEFIPDVSLYLERALMGQQHSERRDKIVRAGKGLLYRYIDQMQALFATGNLPAVIPPSKIFACHDVISTVELRAAIQKLAEIQVTQQVNILDNPNVVRRAQIIANQDQTLGKEWTKKQIASILLKRNTDVMQGAALSTFKEPYNVPQAELSNQLAGGSNGLSQAVDMISTGQVLTLTEEQKEVLRQQVSLFIACLRIRLDAIQSSQWELVTEEDLDHIEMAKYATEMIQTEIGDSLYRHAILLDEAYSNGHNIVKFGRRELPEELQELISYTIQGRARQALKAIPFFETDMANQGEMFKVIMKAIIMAVTLKQRIKLEINERYHRRVAVTDAAQNLIY